MPQGLRNNTIARKEKPEITFIFFTSPELLNYVGADNLTDSPSNHQHKKRSKATNPKEPNYLTLVIIAVYSELY
jgi:hypothetical protein